MESLFTNSITEGGFRLQYVELYNWGTFGGNKAFRLDAGGKTSLLTGANGSGKTTIIDALLTLLVPHHKRFYNQSSGADSRRERSEESYFFGHYGRTFSDEEARSKTEQLRHKNDGAYSVLLAHFRNEARQQDVTLVQLRWYSDGMKRAYVFSPHALSVEEHFGKGSFDTKGQWKKDLKSRFIKTDVWDAFAPYERAFSDAFGLKENALSLFNQTVGIKVLGDLTPFIRTHMLDEPQAEAELGRLYAQYETLLSCYRAIRKDEQQLALLKSVVEGKEALQLLEVEVVRLNELQRTVPNYFDNRERAWLTQQVADLVAEQVKNSAMRARVEEDLATLREEERELIGQLAKADVTALVGALDKQLKDEARQRDSKQNAAKEFAAVAQSIGVEIPEDDTDFSKVQNALLAKEASHHVDRERRDERLYDARRTRDEQENIVAKNAARIASLLARNNRIPDDLVAIRTRLAELLSLPDDELPFAGELMQVRQSERHWEQAIEKVLRPLALQLLVPDELHREVADYANNNDLNTRLIYQRIDLGAAYMARRQPQGQQVLFNKLDLKNNTPFYDWLGRELIDRYDYWCADDMADFHRREKALASSGLIRNKARHEKDDRKHSGRRTEFVLGWSTAETVALLFEEKEVATKEAQSLAALVKTLQEQQKAAETASIHFERIRSVKSFAELDWRRHALAIQDLERRKEELVSTDDAYKALVERQTVVDSLINGKEVEKASALQEGARLGERYKVASEKLQRLEDVALTDEENAAVVTFLAEAGVEWPADAGERVVGEVRKRALALLNARVTAKTGAVSEAKGALRENMVRFIQPPKHITDEFPDWSEDVITLSADAESLDEMVSLHDAIKGQRLVEHRTNFQRYMDGSMLDAFTGFKAWIETERDRIGEVIQALNTPLRSIVFNRTPATTFLQLDSQPTKDIEVRNFQSMLRGSVPSAVGLADDASLEEAFLKIQKLIVELRDKEAWRKKVTDARMWLVFGAQEHDTVTGERGTYYDNTASLSGGQIAQLTYAILGAAIAHQFGIFHNPARSLRFITVDEAFSKLDPDKSCFLMEYCKQLNLQLLIVTPLDKINIAEPYISAVHFAEIRDGRRSYLYNLTMKEYSDRKESFEESTAGNA